MSFRSIDKVIVWELLRGKKQLPLYYFNQMYGYTPSVLSEAVSRLSDSRLIEYVDGKLTLAREAPLNLILNRNELFRRRFDFKQVPDWMLAQRCDFNSFRSPKLVVDNEGHLTSGLYRKRRLRAGG